MSDIQLSLLIIQHWAFAGNLLYSCPDMIHLIRKLFKCGRWNLPVEEQLLYLPIELRQVIHQLQELVELISLVSISEFSEIALDEFHHVRLTVKLAEQRSRSEERR